MGRRPCCEKMGLKKGPWSAEEDQLLINYITLHGHPNWRSLPQSAGLLRCGKSCRLRWINYLRPDIKRGNFTSLEEDTIINLHQILGNRWSAIAAKLPGRTDNEIKNVWHTHLKKRLHQIQDGDTNKETVVTATTTSTTTDAKRPTSPEQEQQSTDAKSPTSPEQQQQSSSSADVSAVTTSGNNNDHISNGNSKDSATSSKDVVPALIDESFWSEVVSMDYNISGDDHVKNEIKIENWEGSLDRNDNKGYNFSKLYNHDMEFWFDHLTTSPIVGEISDISDF